MCEVFIEGAKHRVFIMFMFFCILVLFCTVNFLCVFPCCTNSMQTSPQRPQHRAGNTVRFSAGLETTEMATSSWLHVVVVAFFLSAISVSFIAVCLRGYRTVVWWSRQATLRCVPSLQELVLSVSLAPVLQDVTAQLFLLHLARSDNRQFVRECSCGASPLPTPWKLRPTGTSKKKVTSLVF